jgi:hypothetical protein
MGQRGALTLWGDKPVQHELLAMHLTSEYPTRTEARGNVVQVWQRKPGADNHWLDCLVGCAVAASMEGVAPMAGMGRAARPAGKRRISMAERVRIARGAARELR